MRQEKVVEGATDFIEWTCLSKDKWRKSREKSRVMNTRENEREIPSWNTGCVDRYKNWESVEEETYGGEKENTVHSRSYGGGVFTYIVDLANELVNSYDMYIAYAVRKQTPENYKDCIYHFGASVIHE